MWTISLLITAGAIALHLGLTKLPRRSVFVWEVLLRYYFLIMVGVNGGVAFMGHAFAPDKIAPLIGWAPSPFEYEVAITNLALGVLGVVAFWVKKDFWLATVLTYVIFMVGCGLGHLYELLAHQNYATWNAGWGIWAADVVAPLGLLMAYITYRRLLTKQS